MYTKLYNLPKATASEKNRLNEINFYMLVYNLLNYYKETIQVVNIIELFSQIFKCNTQVISQLILDCLNKNPSFAPRKSELTAILYKCDIPIRTIAGITGLSNGLIYKNVQRYMEAPFEITAKATQKQTLELQKFMSNMNNLSEIIQIWR